MARTGLILLGMAATLICGVWISPAFGQSLCYPRSVLAAHLENRFGEVKVGEGIAANGEALEIVASENGTTWTLFITAPNGRSCLLASGRDWSAIPYRKPEKPL